MKHLPHILFALALSGCSYAPGTFTDPKENAALVQGPPIEDVVTSFDDALTCLRGKIPKGVVFAVGQVIDATGKETYAEGGTGKFASQGAGEMVQSALFRAGVSVVNRRDPQISLVEANWGIRDIKRQVPVNFFVSGSINSLDFIPGGGFTAQLSGIGPKFRQNRILIAIDLTLTDAYTGRIVASVPLQKQIFTREYGGSANTFFGSTLVQLEAGGMEREALHFAQRQMLSLATIELLGQLMKPEVFNVCRSKVEASKGVIGSTGTADPLALSAALRLVEEGGDFDDAPDLAIPVSAPSQIEAASQQSASSAQQPGPVPQNAPVRLSKAAQIGKLSTTSATEAIRAAKNSENAPTRTEAMKLAAVALQKSNDALALLKRAASEGFTGDEGEVAAVVVQQALQAAQKAGREAAEREPDQGAVAKPKPKPTAAPKSAPTPKPTTEAALGPRPAITTSAIASAPKASVKPTRDPLEIAADALEALRNPPDGGAREDILNSEPTAKRIAATQKSGPM
tara:strand:+ start:21039 stop:22577 length:1539 start_codon:yes stop_codon:yes gene_type:complete